MTRHPMIAGFVTLLAGCLLQTQAGIVSAGPADGGALGRQLGKGGQHDLGMFVALGDPARVGGHRGGGGLRAACSRGRGRHHPRGLGRVRQPWRCGCRPSPANQRPHQALGHGRPALQPAGGQSAGPLHQKPHFLFTNASIPVVNEDEVVTTPIHFPEINGFWGT